MAQISNLEVFPARIEILMNAHTFFEGKFIYANVSGSDIFIVGSLSKQLVNVRLVRVNASFG